MNEIFQAYFSLSIFDYFFFIPVIFYHFLSNFRQS